MEEPATLDSAPNVPASAEPARPRRSKWQFSLRIILLLMAAVGVWTAEISNRRVIPTLEQRIAAMRPLARELIINDPAQIAVVRCEEHWYDDNEWEVYLPEGDFRLALATRDIAQQDLAPPVKSVNLPSGKFRLSIAQEKTASGWKVQVLRDGQEILAAEEPAEWYPAQGSSGGGHYDTIAQFPTTEAVVLFRRRFSRPINANSSQTPSVPCEGVLLWIEQMPKDETK